MRRALLSSILAFTACVGVAELPSGNLPGANSDAGVLLPVIDGGDVLLTDAGGDGTPDSGADLDSGPPPDAGPTDPCDALACSGPSHCALNPARCECDPGFFPDGGGCFPGDIGIPAQRTAAQVCAAYTQGLVASTNQPFTKTTATCDPGVLSQAGMNDTLTRLNMYRFLVGLGPVTDDPGDDQRAQECALISAWNPAGPQAHFPQPSATCYTTLGAQGAGSSNIAWGCGTPQNSIDQWLMDFGNETTMGHRRWLLNPPLGPVGFGFYEGGNNYGTAACITVFGGSGGGPSPSWWAMPPPGFSPEPMTQWLWTVHGNIGGGLDAGVTRASDGTALPVSVTYLEGSYGNHTAITLNRSGWSPVAGETYQVHLEGPAGAFDYDVKPVNCP